jgi:predicted nuclease of predicted toxin-antitoxin system
MQRGEWKNESFQLQFEPMPIKLLIDMNLSPLWVGYFAKFEIEAIHWSAVGLAYDADTVIFEYAFQNNYTVFTHDLDFGAILAATNAAKPSVLQLRDEDIFPSEINAKFISSVLQQFENKLLIGALLTINKQRTKVRLLPIRPL